MRRCQACGNPLGEDRRRTAKFCPGSLCRTRFARGHRAPAVVVELPAATAGEAAAIGEVLSLEDVARELSRQLVAPNTPPSAKAQISRELRATIAEINRSKPRERTVIDDLAERRAQRTGG